MVETRHGLRERGLIKTFPPCLIPEIAFSTHFLRKSIWFRKLNLIRILPDANETIQEHLSKDANQTIGLVQAFYNFGRAFCKLFASLAAHSRMVFL